MKDFRHSASEFRLMETFKRVSAAFIVRITH